MKKNYGVDVSVIIPVYNKEDYIERCVKNLIKPANLSYEILLVDDGSDDNSFSICKKLGNVYDCVYVFSQSNQGVSAARNVGIFHARGNYITYVDADDYVTEEYWALMQKALEQEADMNFFNYIRLTKKSKSIGSLPLEPGFYENLVDLRRVVAGLEICILSVCTGLYKKSIIQDYNLKFQVGMKSCEDFLFNLEYIEKISNYAVFEGCTYCYCLNEQSVTMKRPMSHADDYLMVYDVSSKYLERNEATESEMVLFAQRWTRWIIELIFSWKEQRFNRKEIWQQLNDKKYYKIATKCNGGAVQTKIESKLLAWRWDFVIWIYLKVVKKIKQLIRKNDL